MPSERAFGLIEGMRCAQRHVDDALVTVPYKLLACTLDAERWAGMEEAAQTAEHMKHEPGFYVARAIRAAIAKEKEAKG